MSLEIPGYAQAVEQEASNRDLAFCGLPVPVCGILCRFITPRIYVRLKGCGNAFVLGERPTHEDIAAFFWFVSPDYSLSSRARHLFIKHHVAKIPIHDAIIGIYRFLELNFQDAQLGGGGTPRKKYASDLAGIVDVLANEYGWSHEAILDTPLACIYQFIRQITIRRNPSTPLFNRSDKLISEHLASRNRN